jgi:hypothetical protein
MIRRAAAVGTEGARIVKTRRAALLAGLFVGVIVGSVAIGGVAAQAAEPPKLAISEEATAAVARMGKTLQAKEFAFQARTLRASANQNGVLQHIAHQF